MNIESTEFEKFKNIEFLGDKLLNVIVSDLLIDKGYTRNEVNRKLPFYTSNEYLIKVAVKIDLKENEKDLSFSDKKIANAFEYYIFNFFKKEGYDKVKKLISEIFSLN